MFIYFYRRSLGFQAKLWALAFAPSGMHSEYRRMDLFPSLNILSHFQIWSNDTGHCNRREIKIEYFCFHFSCVLLLLLSQEGVNSCFQLCSPCRVLSRKGRQRERDKLLHRFAFDLEGGVKRKGSILTALFSGTRSYQLVILHHLFLYEPNPND